MNNLAYNYLEINTLISQTFLRQEKDIRVNIDSMIQKAHSLHAISVKHACTVKDGIKNNFLPLSLHLCYVYVKCKSIRTSSGF